MVSAAPSQDIEDKGTKQAAGKTDDTHSQTSDIQAQTALQSLPKEPLANSELTSSPFAEVDDDDIIIGDTFMSDDFTEKALAKGETFL